MTMRTPSTPTITETTEDIERFLPDTAEITWKCNDYCGRFLWWNNIPRNNINSTVIVERQRINRALWNEIKRNKEGDVPQYIRWNKAIDNSLADYADWMSSPTFGAKISQWWRHTDLCLNLFLAVPFVFCIFWVVSAPPHRCHAT